MEDGHVMIDGFRGVSHDGFFAVYDGHGGKAAMNLVQKMLHKIFEEELNRRVGSTTSGHDGNDDDEEKKEETTSNVSRGELISRINDALRESYRRMDLELREALYNGTTAVTCYLTTITTSDGHRERLLFTSNVGDARVVLGGSTHNHSSDHYSHYNSNSTGNNESQKSGSAIRLTFDHKASDVTEAQRIRDAQGFVAFNRVNGILAVTRALGDYAMKQWVISEPYQSWTPVLMSLPQQAQVQSQPVEQQQQQTQQQQQQASTYQFIVLACDGLWDVIGDQECVDFVNEQFGRGVRAQDIAQLLLQRSLDKGSTDNISIMVIKL